MSTEISEYLVLKAKAGDHTAFAELVGAMKPVILTQVRTVAKPEDIEDVYQAVLAHVWKNLHKYELRNFRGWVKAVVHNAALDEVNSQDASTRVNRGVDPDKLVRKQSVPDPLLARVPEALERLSPGELGAVILHYRHGYTCAEIATITSAEIAKWRKRPVSTRTVEKQLERARWKIEEYVTTAE